MNFYSKLSTPCKSVLRQSIDNHMNEYLMKGSWLNLWKEVNKKLVEKYAYDRSGYNKIIISDIIKNKPTHMTSIFKEYLVFDEPIEFLKRIYTMKENKSKLNKLNEFHNTYFKVFPNYIWIPEKYYMYKNIERKQRVIDDQQYRIMMKSNGSPEDLLNMNNHSNLFNESYMRHISTFRIKFNSEETKENIYKNNNELKLNKQSIWTSYIQESELIRNNEFKNSMEMILNRVDSSVLCSDKLLTNSASWSFLQMQNPVSTDTSIKCSPIGKLNQSKRNLKDRKSHVFIPVPHQNSNTSIEKVNIFVGLPPTNPFSNAMTTNTSQALLFEEKKFNKSNGMKGSMIEISSSLISNSPQKNDKLIIMEKIPTQRKSPDILYETSDLLRKTIIDSKTTSSKNNKIMKKNITNSNKFDQFHSTDSWNALKARLKKITNKKCSPNKKVQHLSNDRSQKYKYQKFHSKSK